jgi:PAS domain S-box-containing protein
MQDELRSLEQRWGLALQSAQFGVWDLDLGRELVHYSPQWKAMLGYDDADMPDDTAVWRGRVHPDDLDGMLQALRAYLEGRAPAYEREFRLRTAGGAWRWVMSRGRIVERDAAGQPTRVVGTLVDLTDRREAEALRLARDRAEAASQAKTEFISRMSHELRTPLNAVLGLAQLLAQQVGEPGADIEEQRAYLRQVELAGWHLLGLVEDVLDLAQVQSGKVQLAADAVALAPLLQSVVDASRSAAAERRIELRIAPVPAGAQVRANAVRLKQVMTHLLGNAIKYNRDDGHVRLEAAPAPDAAWRIAVVDDGHGIPALQMQHLYEPFNRLGRTGTCGDGVGIGLALTRCLVERMGGQMHAHCVEGQGSRFEVLLPAA